MGHSTTASRDDAYALPKASSTCPSPSDAPRHTLCSALLQTIAGRLDAIIRTELQHADAQAAAVQVLGHVTKYDMPGSSRLGPSIGTIITLDALQWNLHTNPRSS